MRLARIITWTVAAAFAPCADAAEPTIHDLAKSAVERKAVHKTDMLGFSIIHSSYRDAPQNGAILIGFDLALSRWDDRSEIVAVRPVYLTPRGEVVGNAAGSFSGTRDHKISQTVRVVAKPGYAVGRVTMVTGLQIHTMTVTFMKIKGQALDKNDNYRSPMFGSRAGSDNGRTLSSNGGPIVGLFGNVNGPRVFALGLIYAEPPEVEEDDDAAQAAAPAIAPKPAAETPETSPFLEPKPESGPSVVPFVIGGIVVVIVVMLGLGAFFLFNLITSSPTPPPKKTPGGPAPPKKPAPAPPKKPTPTSAADDDIPTVYLADEPEPETKAPSVSTSSSIKSTPPPPATPTTAATPPAPKPSAPTPPAPSPPVPRSAPQSPPSLAPPGQLGTIDYEGDAIAPSDRQAVIGGVVLGGIMLVAAAAMIYFPLQSARDRILVPVLVGGIGVVLTGGSAFGLTRIRKHITVYENGVRCSRGSKQETLFWSDVAAVRDFSVKLYMNGVFQHTTRTIKVRGAGGREIEFSGDANGIGGLADAVLQRAYDYITPRVLQQLANGQTVDLGPLELSSAGVGTRLSTIGWSQISDVQIDNGSVIIFEGNSPTPWKKVLLGDVDNVRLLFALMDHFGGRRTP